VTSSTPNRQRLYREVKQTLYGLGVLLCAGAVGGVYVCVYHFAGSPRYQLLAGIAIAGLWLQPACVFAMGYCLLRALRLSIDARESGQSIPMAMRRIVRMCLAIAVFGTLCGLGLGVFLVTQDITAWTAATAILPAQVVMYTGLFLVLRERAPRSGP